jgi:hypothetical protein
MRDAAEHTLPQMCLREFRRSQILLCSESYNHPGAIEVKLAWKVLTSKEIAGGRFIRQLALVGDPKTELALAITSRPGRNAYCASY